MLHPTLFVATLPPEAMSTLIGIFPAIRVIWILAYRVPFSFYLDPGLLQ